MSSIYSLHDEELRLISITSVGLVLTAILSIYDFIMILTMSDADFEIKYEC